DRADFERAGHLGGEERAVAAERHQRELSRVASALDGDGAHRARHARASEEIDPVGGVGHADPEGRRDLLEDGAARFLGSQTEAARQALGVKVAEREVGVGERDLRAALIVAGGPGHGAGAPRADVQRARAVDAHDAPAARAHLGDVDGGHPQQEAAAPVEPAPLRHRAADLNSPVRLISYPSMMEAFAVVPPMSMLSALGVPIARASAAVAMTPAAGPDS